MILTFASSKGGVGKSTTCAAIASALAMDGERVLLIDLDQNRTLQRWSKKSPKKRGHLTLQQWDAVLRRGW